VVASPNVGCFLRLVLISKSESLLLIPSVILDLLPWVPESFRARFPVSVKLAAREKKASGT